MKRLVLALFGIVAVLVLLLVGLCGLTLGTESGVSWLLGQAQSLAPGMLKVESSKGHLFGRLELNGVRLNLATADIEMDTLVLDWSPRRLLRAEMVVNELSLAVLRYTGKAVEEPPPQEPLQWPIELPAISPPVRLVLSRAELSDVRILSAPEATPLIIDQVVLVAHWGDAGIVVERLDSAGPGHSLAVAGTIDPGNAYRTQLNNTLSLASAGDLAVDIVGSIEGDTQQLEMSQSLSGAAQLDAHLALDRPLESPQWQARLQLLEVPGSLVSADLRATFTGELGAKGDLQSATLTGRVISSSESPEMDALELLADLAAEFEAQHLVISRVELSQRDHPLKIALRGEASSTRLDIQGNWKSLQWPLVAVQPSLVSQRGTLAIKGPVDDYRLDVKTDLAAQDIVEGEWTLAARGNQQRMSIEQLRGGLIGGRLEVSGDVGWSPQVSWKLKANGRDLKPGQWVGDPDAVVQLAASTEGSIGEQGPDARVVLERLGGRLNGKPLTGDGKLSYSPQRIAIDRLQIRNADASVVADGVIGERSNLSWRLQVPDVGKLMADAAGKIDSEGRVTGPRSAPRVVGQAMVDGLALPALRVDRLDASIDLDMQDRNRSDINVDAQTLLFGDNRVDQVQLEFDGFIRQHRIVLNADHPQAAVALAAEGGYQRQWNGRLTRLDLDSSALGPWRLRQPVPLTLSAQQASTERLCLVRERAHLCAEGAWLASGKTNGSFDLAQLPLDWLQALFPEQVKGATGTLSASGELSQTDALQARVRAALTPGELRLEGVADAVRVPHEGVQLALDARDQGVEAELKAGIDRSRLQVQINLPDYLQVADSRQAKIKAKLRVDAPDFDLVPLLVPVVSQIEGSMRGEFTVSGNLEKPWLDGSAQLAAPLVVLDHLGLSLSDTRMDIGVVNNTLTLDGRSFSGGRLGVEGGLLLDGNKSWPLTLNIVGDKFVAINVPNLMVSISPDLKVQRSAQEMVLMGTLTVPAAELLVRDLPAGSRSASRDIVIVRSDGVRERDAEDTLPLDTRIRVILGNEVHLAALGLDGFLRGELSVRGRSGRPLRATGDLRLFDAIFRAYGQRLEIERGLFSYTNSPLDNPGVNVRAVRNIGDVQVGVNALGTAREMIVTTFSSPAMSENDRISYLVTGKPAREGASLSLDRQIAKNLTVGVTVDTSTGERLFISRYRLHRTLYTEVSSSARSSALDLFYTVEVK